MRATRDIVKEWLHRQLEPERGEGRGFSLLSWFLVALVLASFLTIALETEATHPDTAMPPWAALALDRVNLFIVAVFAVEYALRLWVADIEPRFRGPFGRLRYAATPLALADLAAFLPELALTFILPGAQGGLLAALRALRLFRLFKLARYVPAFGIVGDALKRAGPALLASLAVAAAQIYVAALLLYFVEGTRAIPGHPEQMEKFGSVVRALWWSVVTLTTVGYGDVYPVTPLGRFAAALVALAGIGIVAMPTGIIASSFAEEFRLRRERKSGPSDAENGE